MKKSGSTHKIKVRKGNDNFMPCVLSKFFHRPSKNLINILFCKTNNNNKYMLTLAVDL